MKIDPDHKILLKLGVLGVSTTLIVRKLSDPGQSRGSGGELLDHFRNFSPLQLLLRDHTSDHGDLVEPLALL